MSKRKKGDDIHTCKCGEHVGTLALKVAHSQSNSCPNPKWKACTSCKKVWNGAPMERHWQEDCPGFRAEKRAVIGVPEGKERTKRKREASDGEEEAGEEEEEEGVVVEARASYISPRSISNPTKDIVIRTAEGVVLIQDGEEIRRKRGRPLGSVGTKRPERLGLKVGESPAGKRQQVEQKSAAVTQRVQGGVSIITTGSIQATAPLRVAPVMTQPIHLPILSHKPEPVPLQGRSSAAPMWTEEDAGMAAMMRPPCPCPLPCPIHVDGPPGDDAPPIDLMAPPCPVSPSHPVPPPDPPIATSPPAFLPGTTSFCSIPSLGSLTDDFFDTVTPPLEMSSLYGSSTRWGQDKEEEAPPELPDEEVEATIDPGKEENVCRCGRDVSTQELRVAHSHNKSRPKYCSNPRWLACAHCSQVWRFDRTEGTEQESLKAHYRTSCPSPPKLEEEPPPQPPTPESPDVGPSPFAPPPPRRPFQPMASEPSFEPPPPPRPGSEKAPKSAWTPGWSPVQGKLAYRSRDGKSIFTGEKALEISKIEEETKAPYQLRNHPNVLPKHSAKKEDGTGLPFAFL